MQYNIAVIGATGVVGRKIMEIMDEQNIPASNLYLFASEKSEGKIMAFGEKNITVRALTKNSILENKIDFCLMAAGSKVSGEYAPLLANTGAIVIDNSSQWRHDAGVPLVVPEVNQDSISGSHKLIANPNCSTIQAVVALAPLHLRFGIKRIVYTTFQAVSGAGRAGEEDLIGGALGQQPRKFTRRIFDNVIPQIGDFSDDGYTEEENKMVFETRKILNAPQIRVTATAVRVPVTVGHSISVNVEFEKPLTLPEVKLILSKADGVVLCKEDAQFPTPAEVQGRDEVFVGRIRVDRSIENGINMWIVADNLRKGAATNAVQIMKRIILRKEQKEGNGCR